MARIKFLQEDFAAFRPDPTKPYQLRADQITTPAEAIQTIRQGVALGGEVASAGVGIADFLTRAGVIGKQPTKEDLMEQAAKRKAEEARKIVEADRAKLVGGQEALRAEQAKFEAPVAGPIQAGTPDYSRGAYYDKQAREGNRRRWIETNIPAFQQGQLDQNTFFAKILEAEMGQLLSKEEAQALRDQVKARMGAVQEAKGKVGEATQAEAMATQRATEAGTAVSAREKALAEQQAGRQAFATAPKPSEVADLEEQQLQLDRQDYAQRLANKVDPNTPEMMELQNAINNRQEFIAEMRKPNPDPAKLAELDKQVKDAEAVVAETKKKEEEAKAGMATAAQQRAEAQRLAGQREAEARTITAPTTALDVERYVSLLPKEKARQFYVEAASIETRDRTKTESDLIFALEKKYPEFKAEVKTPAGGTREGKVLEVADVNKQVADFKAGMDRRKAEIAASLAGKDEEIRKYQQNIDKALAAYEAKPQEATGAFKEAVDAINGIRGRRGRQAVQSIEELKREKEAIEQYFGGAVQRKLELDESEEARTKALEQGAASFVAAAAELQTLNDKRLKQGKLDPNDASRVVQLRDYLNDNRALQEKLMSVDVANNPKIKELVVGLQKGFFEGKAPAPETKEEREARFADELKVFDTQTQDLIRQATDKAKKEIKDTYYDADQLRIAAVKAALSGNKDEAAKVLAIMEEGKVVGVQPASFTDWLSGDYKKRFNTEIFQTLFTRVKGKSDEEMAVALQNLELKNINTIRQVSETLANLKAKAQELGEKQAGEEDRLAKLDAERRLKEAEAKRKEFESKDEYLKAEFDKLQGQAEKAQAEGKMALPSIEARIRLSNAMAGYYANRNGYALAIAKAGENAEALRATGRNLDDYANDVDKLKANAANEYGKLSQFEKYVDVGADGKPKKSAAWVAEFGTDDRAFDAKLKGLSGRSKDILAERYKAAKLYFDRYGKPGFVDKTQFDASDSVYDRAKAGARELAAILQSGAVQRNEREAPAKIGKVIAAQGRIQKVIDELTSGKIKTQAEAQQRIDEINKAVEQAKRDVGITP